MIAAYVNYLRRLISRLPEIQGESTLKDELWNKSSYERLSQLIFDKLQKQLSLDVKLQKGTTISSRTLYNIFEFKRKINLPLDQRALNTLDKLALYAGLKDWNEIVSSYDNSIDDKKGENGVATKIKHLILKAKESEFHSYNALPEVAPNGLAQYFTKKSKAYAEIYSDLEQHSISNLVISNNYNPSSFEILSLEVSKSKIKENHYVAETEEYWIFCWFDLEQKKYVKKDKRLEKHKYLIKHDKKKDKWLIDVNASKH